MTGRGAYRGTGGLAAAGLLLACALPVSAQEAALPPDAGGLVAELRFSQRLTWEQDEGDEWLTATTGLGFALTSETRRSQFGLFFDSGLDREFGKDGGDDDFQVADPRLRLTYGVENRATAFDAQLSYREADVDTLVEDEELGSDFLVLEDGTRRDAALDLGYVFGRDAPFGGSLDLGYATQTYSDTSDPDLVDEERSSAGLTLRFDLDPRVRAELRAAYAETDRDDPGRDVRSERYGVAVDFAATKTLSAGFYLGQSRITEEIGPFRNVEDGTDLQLSFTEERPDGAFSGSLSSDITESGRRTTVRLGRSRDLPRGALRAEFGLSEGESSNWRPIFALGYGRDLPRGVFNVTLDQAFGTDSDGLEALNSRLNLSYQHELTRISRLQAAISLRESDFLDADADTKRIEFDLLYRHALTEEWDMVSGYTHTISKEQGSARTRSDEVFVGLEKTFTWRF